MLYLKRCLGRREDVPFRVHQVKFEKLHEAYNGLQHGRRAPRQCLSSLIVVMSLIDVPLTMVYSCKYKNDEAQPYDLVASN